MLFTVSFIATKTERRTEMKKHLPKKETLKRKNERRGKHAVLLSSEWNDPEYRVPSFEEAQADLQRWSYVLVV